MKRCVVCGVPTEEGASICSGCGADLRPTKVQRKKGSTGKEQDPPGAAGLLVEPGLWTQSKIGRRQLSTKTGERHFLVPPFGDALRLEAGPPLVLGRDKECEIRVNSPTVSRRHAEVSFKGSPVRALLKDLGTRNGTHVNGDKLSAARELVDRDVVRVGDVTAVYRLLPKGANENTLHDEAPIDAGHTQTVALDSLGGGLQDGITGDMAFVPMLDLLGRLAATKATGELVVEVDGTTGRATYAQGELVSAKFGGLEKEVALRAISELKRGKFRFQPGPKKQG